MLKLKYLVESCGRLDDSFISKSHIKNLVFKEVIRKQETDGIGPSYRTSSYND
jgi:hypothetical protein